MEKYLLAGSPLMSSLGAAIEGRSLKIIAIIIIIKNEIITLYFIAHLFDFLCQLLNSTVPRRAIYLPFILCNSFEISHTQIFFIILCFRIHVPRQTFAAVGTNSHRVCVCYHYIRDACPIYQKFINNMIPRPLIYIVMRSLLQPSRNQTNIVDCLASVTLQQ